MLCCVKDYAGVGLEQLNHYVKKFGPLVNPVFGEQPAFFIDEWTRNGGRVTTSQGTYILEQLPGGPKVRLPDVAYTPRGSQRQALDRKMQNEYFKHGIQLGWLIDPRPDFQSMYEYYLDENGNIHEPMLKMVLNQDSGSSSEDEVDLVCPCPGCNTRFRSPGAIAAHVEWHREERAISKYLAKSGNS
ncbi:Zinc finger C2H2-type/integrase DNA-binding domain [Plasmopara halstedii]|uniref:Zinc finger C2H2-type/integrase DNA-binding domain n=1 Tax=Plasmopara halstedii TaxID=4781 RepID=A0A0P1B628_PLAHL|nr:Zinc finger C2H2-type/integrase DNA-binding domain [Plasmopara halstedii]CEG49810.1 Zinc finger C2H2-type/integrase DNA-binding domain [Plasmopara halstedii]|eukprot:XP_024586179.1 Zinc finger C2H2-type/integrase DNA-binding domain [Plasmopara halstedii]